MTRIALIVALVASTALAQGLRPACVDATATQGGCITTAAQSFAGYKTFTNGVVLTYSMATADSTGAMRITDSSASGSLYELRDGESVAGNYSTLVNSYAKTTGHGIAWNVRPGADGASYDAFRFNGEISNGVDLSTSNLFRFTNNTATKLTLTYDGNLTAALGVYAGAGSSQVGLAIRQGAKFLLNNGTSTHYLSDDGTNLKLTGEPLAYDFTDNSGAVGSFTGNTTRVRGKIASAAATLTVTNSTITTASSVLCQLETIDATCLHLVAVPGSGSAVVTCQASTPATGNTTFSCLVAN